MSDPRLDELARRLEALPPEAWDRPTPPPPPWPETTAEAGEPMRGRFGRAAAPEPAEPSAGRLTRPAPPRRRRFALRPLTASLLAVALLAIGVAVGLLVSGSGDERASEVALRPFDGRGTGGSASVRLVPRAGGDMTVRVTGLRPSGAGDFYELWLLGAKGRLVSLGSFRMPASGTAEMTLPLPADPARYRFLDVSREPDDGDPGHSGISILRGPST